MNCQTLNTSGAFFLIHADLTMNFTVLCCCWKLFWPEAHPLVTLLRCYVAVDVKTIHKAFPDDLCICQCSFLNRKRKHMAFSLTDSPNQTIRHPPNHLFWSFWCKKKKKEQKKSQVEVQGLCKICLYKFIFSVCFISSFSDGPFFDAERKTIQHIHHLLVNWVRWPQGGRRSVPLLF